jgi:phosphohistidine phosphatase SixA
MSRHLYLLRHAEAEPWSPFGNDFSRALSATGIRHASNASNRASLNLTAPDTELCSPAKRTRETLAPFLAHWHQLLSNTEYVESIYGASLNMLLTLVEDTFTYSKRLLMVGHNPGFEELLINVIQTKQAGKIWKMSTGTLVVIEFSGDFRRDARDGAVRHLLQRKDL